MWLESKENLDTFCEKLNEFLPNLKFTNEKFKEKVQMVINVTEGRIITDIFWKPTDGQYAVLIT